MKVKRKCDEKVFWVYNIQYNDETLKFLIYDTELEKWIFSLADKFTPIEEEYFG